MTDNNNNGDKIRKVLFNEVSLVVSIVAVAIGILLFIVRPDAQMKQDLALIKQDVTEIKTNHLPHIQAAVNDHEDKQRVKEEKTDRLINNINIKLERILTLLGE